MLANWVKETTATSGTGTITLAGAVTGFVAFTDILNNLDVVQYVIEDGNNREIGVGTFTTSGTTLARDTVLETLVSGTLDTTAPAAITLSGSANVSIAPSAYSSYALPSPASITGSYIVSTHFAGPFGSNYTLAADELYVVPFKLENPFTVNSLGLQLTGIASSNIRFGLATTGLDGGPDQLILETASLDGSTTSAVTGSVGPQELKPGLYWGLINSNAAHVISSLNGSFAIHVVGCGTGNQRSILFKSGPHTYGVLPTDVGAAMDTNYQNVNLPILRLYR